MPRHHKIHPPLVERAARNRRRVFRVLINALVLLGGAAVYYLVFSTLFDTPAEHRMRESSRMLGVEYDSMAQRMEQLERVLDNVSKRDSSIFRMMFESEPYATGEDYGQYRWDIMERLDAKSNNELHEIMESETGRLYWSISMMNERLTEIDTIASTLGRGLDNIPSIQPVINDELTLLTASAGMRIHPFYKTPVRHTGVDFTVPEGSRVFATADGVVAESIRRHSSSGVSVVIDHGNGYRTYYNHLDEAKVGKGQSVRRGDIIALSGNTGLSLVPHLHYEIRLNGEPVDPLHYFFMELSPREYHRLLRIARSGMQAFD